MAFHCACVCVCMCIYHHNTLTNCVIFSFPSLQLRRMGRAKAWIAWEAECAPRKAWRWCWKWGRVSLLTSRPALLSLSLACEPSHMYKLRRPPHIDSFSHTLLFMHRTQPLAWFTVWLTHIGSSPSHITSHLYSTERSELVTAPYLTRSLHW